MAVASQKLARIASGFSIRTFATSAISRTSSVKVSHNLQFRPAPQEHNEHLSAKRPLVVFFPWLYAKNSGVQKYVDLYHQRGLDVLSVRCELKQFLWPNFAKELAKEVLGYLSKEQAEKETIIVHSTSVGAYVYTVVLMELIKNADKYKNIQNKVVGQVFDSLTMGSVDHMINGIVGKINNRFFRTAVRTSINTFFYLSKRHSVDFHNEAVDAFKSVPIKTPVLLYYSLDDPMCKQEDMSEMLQTWNSCKDKRFKLRVVRWTESVHSAHLFKHPEDYKGAIDEFLKNFGLDIVHPGITRSKL